MAAIAAEGDGDAARIGGAPRRQRDQARGFRRVIGKAHPRALAIGGSMVERQGQITKRLGECSRAGRVAAPGAAFEKGGGPFRRQDIERDLLGPPSQSWPCRNLHAKSADLKSLFNFKAMFDAPRGTASGVGV